MRSAYRLVVHLFACSLVLIITGQFATAQNRKQNLSSSVRLPSDLGHNFTAHLNFDSRLRTVRRSSAIEASLYDAIMDRLGAPYRAQGTDERGYDCSGFVWRVFQEAGLNFRRSSARTLWEGLPAATDAEATQFGTLVFFKGLGHVGIVRDAYSFYHASTSQGVVRSFYSGYWRHQVLGYRRVPLPDGWEPAGR